MLLDDVRLCVRGDGRVPSFFGLAYFPDTTSQLSPARRSPAPLLTVGLLFAKILVRHTFPRMRSDRTCEGEALRATCRPVAAPEKTMTTSGRVGRSGRGGTRARSGRTCRTPMRTCVRGHRLDCSRGAPPLVAPARVRASAIRVRAAGDSGSPLRALRYPCTGDHRTGRIPIRYPRAPLDRNAAFSRRTGRPPVAAGYPEKKSDEIVGGRDNTVSGIGRSPDPAN